MTETQGTPLGHDKDLLHGIAASDRQLARDPMRRGEWLATGTRRVAALEAHLSEPIPDPLVGLRELYREHSGPPPELPKFKRSSPLPLRPGIYLSFEEWQERWDGTTGEVMRDDHGKLMPQRAERISRLMTGRRPNFRPALV